MQTQSKPDSFDIFEDEGLPVQSEPNNRLTNNAELYFYIIFIVPNSRYNLCICDTD